MNTDMLVVCLKLAAVGQFILALLSVLLPRLLDWQKPIEAMPLLVREVFLIHAWFIALTLIIFSALTWRFASEMAGGGQDFLRWFACAIGFFWALRCVMQWTHYSGGHWRGIPSRTAVHWIVFISYGAFATTYFVAGLSK